MREFGVAAAALNSMSDGAERQGVYSALENRTLRLLYVAPERLLRDDTLELLHRYRIDLLAIDEAHCVSQWGHDFRPEYMRLREAAQALDRPKTIAVTATADEPTRRDIAERLFFRAPESVRALVRPAEPVPRDAAEGRRDAPALGRAATPQGRKRHHLLRVAPAHRGAGAANFPRGAGARCPITPGSTLPCARPTRMLSCRRTAS